MPTSTLLLHDLLLQEIQSADEADMIAAEVLSTSGEKISVPTAGMTVASAYEQLRNAADNAEEHLLLQRAIKRFYRRSVVLRRPVNGLAHELISELVLAGYVTNESVGVHAVSTYDTIADDYMQLLAALKQQGVASERATEWVLACLSSDIESRLKPHHRRRALLAVTFQHFLRVVQRASYTDYSDERDFELCLYYAVHQAIAKSDIDAVRADLRTLYRIEPTDVQAFRLHNEALDRLFTSPLTVELRKLVSVYGAPFRVLKAMISQRPDMRMLLLHREQFLDAYNWQTTQEYTALQRRLDTALVKSIVFIFITKMLIGVSLEVPYDLLVYGSIVWVPLIINLLAPPVYMALLRFGVQMPRRSRGDQLVHAIEASLFTTNSRLLPRRRRKMIGYGRQFMYTVLFGLPVAGLFVVLYMLHFNWLQMVIFFVFFSTASSLAFRLNAQARELELSRQTSGFLGSVRDFLQLPFVVMGQWLSSKYQQFNLISRMLDIVIELPLKVVLRLLRQWIRFFDEQREQLY